MARAPRSGISVNAKDVPTILAMVGRGDRRHDIAAWFGLNQGRIKEVEDGMHGPVIPTKNMSLLPPSGSPGIKARELRRAISKIHQCLSDNPSDVKAALDILDKAAARFDKNE